jgi:hypothetical protein
MPVEERIVHPDGRVEVVVKRTAKDYFSYWVYFLRGLAGLLLAIDMVAFGIVMYLGVSASNLDVLEKSFLVLSNIGFCAIAVVLLLAEVQWVWFVKKISCLHFWAVRGAGQAWIGTQTISSVRMLGAAVASHSGGDSKALTTFVFVVGWMVFSTGIVFIIMSALCLRSMAKLDADQTITAELLAMETGGEVIVQKTVVKVENVASPTAAPAAANDLATSASTAVAEAATKELREADALIRNLATALDISPVVAKSRFGGPSGAAAAEKYAKERSAKELPPL